MLYTNQTIIPSKPLQVNPRYANILASPSDSVTAAKRDDAAVSKISNDVQVPTISKTDETKEEVLTLFDRWTQSFHRVQKCKMEMQKHRSIWKETEAQLKIKLKKYLEQINDPAISVPFQERNRGVKRSRNEEEEEEQITVRPAFLTVHEQEKKKAFSGKLLRELLTKHFGEEKGQEVFSFLNDNRVTDQKVSTIKILKGPRYASLL